MRAVLVASIQDVQPHRELQYARDDETKTQRPNVLDGALSAQKGRHQLGKERQRRNEHQERIVDPPKDVVYLLLDGLEDLVVHVPHDAK